MNKVDDYYELDLQQADLFAGAIQEAESEGKVVAVVVAFHDRKGHGFGRVIHGSREAIFIHKNQFLTPGVGVGRYFRCRLRATSRLPVGDDIEFYQDDFSGGTTARRDIF